MSIRLAVISRGNSGKSFPGCIEFTDIIWVPMKRDPGWYLAAFYHLTHCKLGKPAPKIKVNVDFHGLNLVVLPDPG